MLVHLFAVCPYVSWAFFSGVTYSFFLIFGTVGKKCLNWPQNNYFSILENFVINFSYKQSKMKINIFMEISAPILRLAKFWVSSYGSKCCQPIKFQDSLNCNNSRNKWMMKFIFRMQINIEVFLPFWVCITRHSESTQNNFACLVDISGKTWGMRLIFCLQINPDVLNNLIVPLWMGVDRHAQTTQSDKFTISLQHLKEHLKDVADFLSVDKRQKFL